MSDALFATVFSRLPWNGGSYGVRYPQYNPAPTEESLEAPLVGSGPQQQWDAVQDLDRFLTDLYAYYYEGGSARAAR